MMQMEIATHSSLERSARAPRPASNRDHQHDGGAVSVGSLPLVRGLSVTCYPGCMHALMPACNSEFGNYFI